MQAAMKHSMIDVLHHHPRRTQIIQKKEEEKDYDKEIHLIQQGSPLGNLGFNDVVHLGKDIIMSCPCLPLVDAQEE